jgi:glycosyltransferase involved in cell wall biosynthesis
MQSFLPSEGGTERATFRLSRELVNLGHRVTVLTFNNMTSADVKVGIACNAGLLSHEAMNEIDVFRFNYSCLGSGLEFSLPLACNLLKTQVDVIHFQGFFCFPHLLLGVFCSSLKRVPMFLTTHGLHETLSLISEKNVFLKGTTFSFVKLGLKTVNFIALSKADKLVLTQFGINPTQIWEIPNGADGVSLYDKQKVDNGVIAKYSIPKQRFVLCVSRIARNKGLHTFLIAASEISKTFDDIAFVIVGRNYDKTYQFELINLARKLGISNTTVFLERIPDEDLESLYNLAQVFVLPSEQETLPLVIFEAMEAGLPVIATSVGGIPQIIQDGVNGLLVQPNDSSNMANLMKTLLTDEDLRQKIAHQAGQKSGRYSWREVARKTASLYSLANLKTV